MNNNIKLRIHFVLEGYEENTLFEIIDDFRKKKNMEKIKLSFQNCKGGGNVPIYFQSALADDYDFVYCVYDVDFCPFDEKGMFKRIRKGLYKVLGSDKDVDNVSLCTNPNILLIILLGYDSLQAFKDINADKKSNTELIKKYCNKMGNKKEYDAEAWQLELLKNDYVYDNKASIEKILVNIDKINENYLDNNEIGSNILHIIKALINDDVEYFVKIINDTEQ